MDMPEDKKPPAEEAAAGPTDATPAAQAGPPTEAKSEMASVEAPSIVPSASEPIGIKAAASEAPKPETPKPGAKPNDAASARPKAKVPATIDLVAASTSTGPRVSKRSLRIAPLAAAAVVGLVAGALGATAVPPLGALLSGTPAPVAPVVEQPSATAIIAQMRSDLAALKASTEAASRSTGAQLAKLTERFDRFERAQAAAKTDMAAKETTGTVTVVPAAPLPPPPPASAAALPSVPVGQPGIVSGWVLRDVYRGNAILQSRMGGMIEVGPGDILPGVGRIEAIRRQDGRWVVITARGMIVSMR
jgi:hypothetical protein